MIIRNKGIYPDRFEDAPWCGTLISAISCPYNCPGCINDPIKSITYDTIDSEVLIKRIRSDKFSKGIILAGLEWSMQPDELIELIDTALFYGLNIILYTYHPDRESLINAVPDLEDYSDRGILVKYGKYDETKIDPNYWSHGVKLATTNQRVEEL